MKNKDLQLKIQNIIDKAVAQGHELGIQLAAYQNGELVLDCCAGYLNEDKQQKVSSDTLFPVFSTSKGIAASLCHVVAEKNNIDYDTKVADIWPEFGCNGKEDITIRHILTHTCALHNMPAGLTLEDLSDWDKMCEALASQAPTHKAGEAYDYHAVTYSWLVGEIASRIDGRPFQQILKEEICLPFNIDGIFIGIDENVDESKIATLYEPNVNPDMVNAPDTSPIPGMICPLHEWMNTAAGRYSCLPASSGIMNARSIARHYASLLSSGIDGKSLISEEQLNKATTVQYLNDGTEINALLGYNQRKSFTESTKALPAGFGNGGYGGSTVFANKKLNFSFALAKNLFGMGSVTEEIAPLLMELMGNE